LKKEESNINRGRIDDDAISGGDMPDRYLAVVEHMPGEWNSASDDAAYREL